MQVEGFQQWAVYQVIGDDRSQRRLLARDAVPLNIRSDISIPALDGLLVGLNLDSRKERT
jgi:hypothetical protein